MSHDYRPYERTATRAGRRPKDPFLARLATLVGIIVTLLPVAYLLRSGNSATVTSPQLPGAVAVIEAGTASPTPDATAAAAIAGVDAPAPGPLSEGAIAPPAQVGASPQPSLDPMMITAAAPPTLALASEPAVAAPVVAAPTTPPTAAATAPTSRPATTVDIFSCPKVYEVVAGDYWFGIARRHQVSLDALLAQNAATTEQPLYPGRQLCLPEDAIAPVPTTPAAAATTTAAAPTRKAPAESPATTQPPATTRPRQTTTTAVPATTAAPKPTTTAPRPTTTAPAVEYGDGEIEAIIRAVWPDDQEEKALAIAWRESNHKPGVRNYCCYGLFQIYFDQHKRWLADIGVDSADDLYDPQVNAYAALVLYQRAGGWGPWGG